MSVFHNFLWPGNDFKRALQGHRMFFVLFLYGTFRNPCRRIMTFNETIDLLSILPYILWLYLFSKFNTLRASRFLTSSFDSISKLISNYRLHLLHLFKVSLWGCDFENFLLLSEKSGSMVQIVESRDSDYTFLKHESAKCK